MTAFPAKLRCFREAVRAERLYWDWLDTYHLLPLGVVWRRGHDQRYKADDALLQCQRAFGVWSLVDPMLACQDTRDRIADAVKTWGGARQP